jgi:putative nucleotidyltransferase with HDIG domain
MRDTAAKRMVSRKRLIAAVLVGAVTLLVVFTLIAVSITPVKYDIAVGEVAPATITASRDIVDEISTEAARAEARAAVADVYTRDGKVTESVSQNIAGYYKKARQQAESLHDAYTAQLSNSIYSGEFNPANVNWDSFLTSSMKANVRRELDDPGMPDSAIVALARMTDSDITAMEEAVLTEVQNVLSRGVLEEELAAELNSLEGLLRQRFSFGTLYLAYYPVERYLTANIIYDEVATEAAREAAAETVPDVIYKQNQTVVSAGEVVTEEQYAVLQALGVVGGEGVDYTLYVGMLLLLLLVFAAYGFYVYQFEAQVLADTRKLMVLATIIVVVVSISVPLARLDPRILPVLFGTMLACMLVSQESALAFNVLLAVVSGIICSWNTGILSETMIKTMLVTIVGGSVAVFALIKPGHRGALIFSGLLSGLAGAVVIALVGMVGTANVKLPALLIDSAFALGSGLLSGVLAIGTLPIWEAVFRVSTPSKLLELSNPNHPLLKRLSIEAPGTYHHSILTANLAEAGADAVGANALLCRVGAYYHDVGKLKNPRYFKENQRGGENPHDQMNPRESAKIITSHIGYGLELAQKYKLPRDVQRIIAQHHGDGVVPYFYHKATEAGLEVNETDFYYRGTRPSTKEAAIVMLADCVEAAVHSMDDPTREQVKEMIDKLIFARFTDGQLDDSPFNRRDMSTLAKAFLSVYEGVLHERVKYPGQE